LSWANETKPFLYMQQLRRSVGQSTHNSKQDEHVLWRLPWSRGPGNVIPLFRYQADLLESEDTQRPKAPWQLVWTHSML
jgi:hypothetical protein